MGEATGGVCPHPSGGAEQAAWRWRTDSSCPSACAAPKNATAASTTSNPAFFPIILGLATATPQTHGECHHHARSLPWFWSEWGPTKPRGSLRSPFFTNNLRSCANKRYDAPPKSPLQIRTARTGHSVHPLRICVWYQNMRCIARGRCRGRRVGICRVLRQSGELPLRVWRGCNGATAALLIFNSKKHRHPNHLSPGDRQKHASTAFSISMAHYYNLSVHCVIDCAVF